VCAIYKTVSSFAMRNHPKTLSTSGHISTLVYFWNVTHLRTSS